MEFFVTFLPKLMSYLRTGNDGETSTKTDNDGRCPDSWVRMNAFLIVVISIAAHQHCWLLPANGTASVVWINFDVRVLISCAYCVPHFIHFFVDMNTLDIIFLSVFSSATLFRHEKLKRQFTYIFHPFLPYHSRNSRQSSDVWDGTALYMFQACASREYAWNLTSTRASFYTWNIAHTDLL